MNGWVDESMDRRLDGGMDGWIDGWAVEWVDGWMNEWIDGWMAVSRRGNISEPTCKTIKFLKKNREYCQVPMHCIFYFQTSDSKGTRSAFPTASRSAFSFQNTTHWSLGFHSQQRAFEVKTLPVRKYKWERHPRANTFSRETPRKIIPSLPPALESGRSSRPYLKVGPFCIYSLDTNQLVEVCNPSKTTTGHRIQCPPIPHSEGVIFLQHSQAH